MVRGRDRRVRDGMGEGGLGMGYGKEIGVDTHQEGVSEEEREKKKEKKREKKREEKKEKREEEKKEKEKREEVEEESGKTRLTVQIFAIGYLHQLIFQLFFRRDRTIYIQQEQGEGE